MSALVKLEAAIAYAQHAASVTGRRTGSVMLDLQTAEELLASAKLTQDVEVGGQIAKNANCSADVEVGKVDGIDTDGPHAICDERRWLSRVLIDSCLSDDEARSLVAHHPSIKQALASPPVGEVDRDVLSDALNCALDVLVLVQGQVEGASYAASEVLAALQTLDHPNGK